MTRKYFRRLFVDTTFDPPRIGAEISPCELYTLPNPMPSGRVYPVQAMLNTVAHQGTIAIELWERKE